MELVFVLFFLFFNLLVVFFDFLLFLFLFFLLFEDLVVIFVLYLWDIILVLFFGVNIDLLLMLLLVVNGVVGWLVFDWVFCNDVIVVDWIFDIIFLGRKLIFIFFKRDWIIVI